MNRKVTIVILLACLICNLSDAQDKLSLQQAMEIALSQNHKILQSENVKRISENNAIPGNAGLLPTMDINGSIDYGLNNTKLKFNEGQEVQETKGAESWNYNATVGVNYTVFSGFANRNTYKQLKVLADQGEIQNLLNIENVVLQVASTYFNVMRASDNVNSLQESILISNRRVMGATISKEYSGGSNLDILNAKVNLNQDSVAFLNARRSLSDAIIDMNHVLGRDLSLEFTIDEELSSFNVYQYEALKEEMLTQNYELQIAKLNEQNSLLDYKIAKSLYMPKVNLSSSYSYNRNDTEGSFLRLNERNGLGVNLNLNIPIYSGGSRKSSLENTKIARANDELNRDEILLTLESKLLKAFQDYDHTLTIVQMSRKNLKVSEENFEYTEEKAKLGQQPIIVLREAQLNLLLSKNSLNSYVYNLRLIELEILRLSGRLVKATTNNE